MRISILLLVLVSLLPGAVLGQVAYDENGVLPATLRAYPLSAEPTIDADGSEWADIPWINTSFNDRDFTEADDAVDPIPARLDFTARYKVAWVASVQKFFFYAEITDDEFFNLEGQSIFHKDGMEIRIDPLDENPSGEPDGTTSATNLIFGFNETVPNFEGAEPTVEAAWSVDESVFPMAASFEMSVEMPATYPAAVGHELGFHVYFNENDDEDDSPDNKNAVLQSFPQLFSVLEQRRLGVDELWSSVSFWGGFTLEEAPTVHQVTEGMSIQATIDAAAIGDIIEIGPGTYEENLVISTPDLTIRGTLDETGQTRITPAVKTDPTIQVAETAWRTQLTQLYVYGFFDNGGTEDRAQVGINIDGIASHLHRNVIEGFLAPLDVLSDDDDTISPEAVVIEDNIFQLNSGSVNVNTVNSSFRYNMVRETGPSGYAVRSLGLTGENNAIDFGYNVIYNARECGIGYGGDGASFHVHHNLIYRSYAERTSPTREMDDGIENQEGTTSQNFVFNNTVVGWDSDGMQFNGPSLFFARNNIVAYTDNKDYDLRDLPPADIDYGISYENGGGNEITGFGSVFFTDNPMFIDETTDNYGLTSSSPAVDAGELHPFGFKVQYFGENPDIGAFELGLDATNAPLYGPAFEVLDALATSVEQLSDEVPSGYRLDQNYPNPFNPTTQINFTVPTAGQVKITVHNALGQEVAVLVDSFQPAGSFATTWNAQDHSGRLLPSGVYFYRMQAENHSVTRSMTLLK